MPLRDPLSIRPAELPSSKAPEMLENFGDKMYKIAQYKKEKKDKMAADLMASLSQDLDVKNNIDNVEYFLPKRQEIYDKYIPKMISGDINDVDYMKAKNDLQQLETQTKISNSQNEFKKQLMLNVANNQKEYEPLAFEKTEALSQPKEFIEKYKNTADPELQILVKDVEEKLASSDGNKWTFFDKYGIGFLPKKVEEEVDLNPLVSKAKQNMSSNITTRGGTKDDIDWENIKQTNTLEERVKQLLVTINNATPKEQKTADIKYQQAIAKNDQLALKSGDAKTYFAYLNESSLKDEIDKYIEKERRDSGGYGSGGGGRKKLDYVVEKEHKKTLIIPRTINGKLRKQKYVAKVNGINFSGTPLKISAHGAYFFEPTTGEEINLKTGNPQIDVEGIDRGINPETNKTEDWIWGRTYKGGNTYQFYAPLNQITKEYIEKNYSIDIDELLNNESSPAKPNSQTPTGKKPNKLGI